MRTSNGDLNLRSMKIDGGVTADTTNGKIDISDITIAGSFETNTTNGSATCDKVSSKDFSTHSVNGKIYLSGVTCLEDLTGTTTNGEVVIKNISVGTGIKLQSTNGRVAGTIKGDMRDFGITSHTSNGSNNLPQSLPGGTKALDVSTSNGAIDISFIS